MSLFESGVLRGTIHVNRRYYRSRRRPAGARGPRRGGDSGAVIVIPGVVPGRSFKTESAKQI
jgi:hypothetical protein